MGGAVMLVGYLADTNIGSYDQPIPTVADTSRKIDLLIEEAIEAEKAGFDSVIVPERHMRTETYMPDPFTLLNVLARETKSIRLGTYASVLTVHNPMQFAERAALLDLLSHGRLFLTLARGYHSDYWRMMGVPEEGMTRRFVEGVEVVRRALAGERFSFHGETMSFDDVFLTPLPFQRGEGPPIWGGGHFPAAIERAGTYANAWSGHPFPYDPAFWKDVTSAYLRSAEEHGRPSMVAMMRDGFVADSRQKAYDIFGDHVVRENIFYMRAGGHDPGGRTESEVTVENLREHLVLGNPDDCVEALQRFEQEYGCEYVVLRMRMPEGPSLEQSIEAIRLFGSEVLPRVQTGRDRFVHPALPPLRS